MFCYYQSESESEALGLIGMEFNSAMSKNPISEKKFWQKSKKVKMTLFLNIQPQREWIDSFLKYYPDDEYSSENDKCYPIWIREGGRQDRDSGGSSILESRMTITIMIYLSFGSIVTS